MRASEPEAIETELRQGRPEATPAFAAELDAWAAEGFPRRERAAAPRRPPRPARRWLLPALGFGVTAAIVIGVAVQTSEQGPGVDSAPQPSVPDVSAPQSESGAIAEGGSLRAAPSADDRVQEKTASITLSAEPDDVPDVAQDASEVTSRFGGVVQSISVRTNDSDRATARLQLAIPAQNLESALGELSGLGQVESRDESLLEITKAYNSAGKRFNNARERVSELVAALAGADDPEEIAGLREQLRTARQRLRLAREQLREVKQRGNNSRVDLTVVSEQGGWSLGDAAGDAVGVLEAIGGGLLIALAVILPLGALAALLWLLSGGLRRRWRERVLDE